MGKRRGGELGVNKKGTPLYSREDIREQYCINDKELQVLDRQGSKGFFGCFSNQGQVIQIQWGAVYLFIAYFFATKNIGVSLTTLSDLCRSLTVKDT